MKLLVETTGPFILMDYSQDKLVEHDRPTVVKHSNFIQLSVSQSRLKILGAVSDEATDAAFVEALEGSKDIVVAVEAFLAEFGDKPVTEKEAKPAPKPKASASKPGA